MKITRKNKIRIRKAIKVIYAITKLLVIAAFWLPIFTYVVTREIMPSLIAFGVFFAIGLLCCFVGDLVEPNNNMK